MSERICARDGYGRLITPGEIQLITGYNYEAACREHAFVRLRLGTESEDLLVSQYCRYNNLDYDEILDFLESAEPEIYKDSDPESDEKTESEFDTDFVPESEDENEPILEDELKAKIESDLVDDFEINLQLELWKMRLKIMNMDATKPK